MSQCVSVNYYCNRTYDITSPDTECFLALLLLVYFVHNEMMMTVTITMTRRTTIMARTLVTVTKMVPDITNSWVSSPLTSESSILRPTKGGGCNNELTCRKVRVTEYRTGHQRFKVAG